MRVMIDSSFLDRGPSGTAVYLERLLEALHRDPRVDVVEARQRGRMRPGRGGRRWNPLRSGANAVLDGAWLHVLLPRAARRARADVLHHPLPAWSAATPCPQVVTVHDAAPLRLPEHFDPLWRRVAARRHRTGVRRAGAVVCVSQAAAAAAVDLLGADARRVVVARHGPGQELPEARAGRPRHFLYVGDDEPRKNLETLLAAYGRYRDGRGHPLDLVLAGSSAARAGAPGVRGERRPDGPRLAALYADALALVHPSLDEGFGLTLAEAMAQGVPVVAVRNPGSLEVCGDAALLVDAGALADALVRVADDEALRADLAERGRRRARAFSWRESADRHREAYEMALGAGRTAAAREAAPAAVGAVG